MAFARVACRAQVGLSAPLVHVEVSLASGLPTFSIVGLPAMVVREAKERVRAALLNSQFEFPAGRITVNLAPADLPKEGGRFDLPIALGVLLASGQLRSRAGGERGAPLREFYGELGLTGELKPVRGLLPAAAQARRAGHELVVPRANAAEACAGASELVRAADHLLEVCAHVAGIRPLAAGGGPDAPRTGSASTCGATLDLADVRGQLQAKRALILAAAGGHSLFNPCARDPFFVFPTFDPRGHLGGPTRSQIGDATPGWGVKTRLSLASPHWTGLAGGHGLDNPCHAYRCSSEPLHVFNGLRQHAQASDPVRPAN
jgi:magnesium chelatase family protein